MISRQWWGLAKPAFADAYVEHLHTETFPAIRKLPGFITASILRRSVPEGVEFLVITHWASIEAIRAFAGANAEAAVKDGETKRFPHLSFSVKHMAYALQGG